MTGKSQENHYQYLFTCQVEDMAVVEQNLKNNFLTLREEKSQENYFYIHSWGQNNVHYLQTHPQFLHEIYLQPDENKPIVKIIQKTKPSLQGCYLITNDVLQKTQRAKNGEFYTRIEDGEKELSMYELSIGNDKIVFCNCDDAFDRDTRRTSAFTLYFIQNLQKLRPQKLICTHNSGTINLFHQGTKGYIFIKDRFREMKDDPSNYTGSFVPSLSLKILTEEADIACTPPTFSKTIDYWKKIDPSGKLFLIISKITNPITKAFIPFLKIIKFGLGTI